MIFFWGSEDIQLGFGIIINNQGVPAAGLPVVVGGGEGVAKSDSLTICPTNRLTNHLTIQLIIIIF